MPSRMRSLGRMKRSACPTRPAATSSDVASIAVIGKPPASADEQPFPRSVGPYCLARSHTAAQPARNWATLVPVMFARHISNSRFCARWTTIRWQSPLPAHA